MKNKHILVGLASLLLMLTLAACADNNGHKEKSSNDGNQSNSHENMEMHSGSGKVPKGLEKAKNPKFEVGSKVTSEAKHMKGMNGAKAKVVGAYDTTAYAVSYKPTTGGKKVKNHKWVIKEEMKNADNKSLKPGTKVTLESDHMKGMKGAKATIDSAKKTTVYMIDYKPTTGGKKVKNHKWVIESELSAR